MLTVLQCSHLHLVMTKHKSSPPYHNMTRPLPITELLHKGVVSEWIRLDRCACNGVTLDQLITDCISTLTKHTHWGSEDDLDNLAIW